MPRSSSDAERFDLWVREHVAVLYRVAYRLIGSPQDAEDVVQDTFRSAWTSRELYDSARSERAWLMAILRRRVADHWRGREPRHQHLDTSPVEPSVREAEPFADELSAMMQRGLALLPEEIREALLLVVVGELTHQEAADIQGVPLGTVLSRVSRGRRRLREALLAAGQSVAAATSVAGVGENRTTAGPRGGRTGESSRG
ncbi:MAG: RNA polymerase sigma factor [Planctomycetia bacterium]|jgi:RNA polymerase sigma-70 factor (ECF subfamily)